MKLLYSSPLENIKLLYKKPHKVWNKGLTKETDSRIKLIAESKLGNLNSSKRPEVRDKISKSQIGKKQSQETIEKRKLKITGKKRTSEQKEKIRKAKLGKLNSNYGKKNSLESNEKNRKSQNKRYENPLEREKIGKAHLGKKHTFVSIEKMSKSQFERFKNPKEIEKISGKNCHLYGKTGKNHPAYGKTPSQKSGYGKGTWYESPLLGKIWLRSSYELAYAKYLDSIGEEYYYEPSAFCMNINGKDTTYTPDFYLPNKGKFVEVKGWWRDNSKAKFDYFTNIPEINEYFGYELLMKEDLQKLGIKLNKKV